MGHMTEEDFKNSIGMQLRFHTHSGASFEDTVERIFSKAIKHANGLIEAKEKREKWIPLSEIWPIHLASIEVTDGKTMLLGGFYEGPDKFCASLPGGETSCYDFELFTHWRPSTALPQQEPR
jgi:hypothetical protein